MFLNSQLPSLQGTLLLDIFLCQEEEEKKKRTEFSLIPAAVDRGPNLIAQSLLLISRYRRRANKANTQSKGREMKKKKLKKPMRLKCPASLGRCRNQISTSTYARPRARARRARTRTLVLYHTDTGALS